MIKKNIFVLLILAIFFFFAKCCSDERVIDEYVAIENYEEGEELGIGKFTTPFINNDAFGIKIPNLDQKSNIKFFIGDRLFSTAWVPSPASTTGLDGLGPTFNSKSCANCHFKDGRGSPLKDNTLRASNGFLMRLSVHGSNSHGGPKPVPGYGNQLQNKGILRVKGEGHIKVTYKYIDGKYPDGTKYQLQQPVYSFYDLNFGSLNNVLTSPRVGTQTIGLGFIDALDESEILKNVDEFDTNNDGISGKANYVWDVEKNKSSLGKFGWKANEPSLRQQVAGAFNGDMGLTTSVFPDNNCPSPQKDCYDSPTGGEPEVTDRQLERIVFYQSTLAVPIRRDYKDKNVLKGKVLFNKLKCISCHTVGFKVNTYEKVPQINGTVIRPYSDFLLHDMGEALADNRPDFLATGVEWRTQPLWGIGLIETVNQHTFFLHDGRARNVEEAILWHGGEAEKAKNDFKALNKKQRDQVLKFVNSL